MEHNAPTWRKSTFCGSAACVEVATTPTGPTVRDGKDPDGPTLDFAPGAWSAFVAELKHGGLVA